MHESGYPLELDEESRRELGDAMLAYADAFVAQRTSAPAASDAPSAEMIAELLAQPPEIGGPLEPLLAKLDRAIDTGIDTASGSHMSYIPSGGIYSGAIATFLGSVTNRYTGGNHGSPGAVAIEESVIRWLCSLFGYGAGSGGILLSGGSVANLTATVAAREALGDEAHRGVVYTSERAHHSVKKAARIAGVAADRIRPIPADDRLRLDATALQATIDSDIEHGLRPMMVVATAGTTDTGTIDPLEACADVATGAGAWLHVDAAYGGFFILTERGAQRLEGIERADSITVDAHKSLFLPFGVGGLVVRDRQALVEAHEGRGAYMQDVEEFEMLPQYFALGPELTRPFRGLAAWLPLHLHGIARFRTELDRMLDLAEWAATELSRIETLQLAAATDLSVVSFRSRHDDDETRRIFDGINAAREVHVSSTTVADRLTIRMALLSQRTTAEKVRRAISTIRNLAATS